MFTIGGGTAQILRNQLAGRLLADGPPPVAMRRASA
jgi:hypothetical protein